MTLLDVAGDTELALDTSVEPEPFPYVWLAYWDSHDNPEPLHSWAHLAFLLGQLGTCEDLAYLIVCRTDSVDRSAQAYGFSGGMFVEVLLPDAVWRVGHEGNRGRSTSIPGANGHRLEGFFSEVFDATAATSIMRSWLAHGVVGPGLVKRWLDI